jgi:cytochrome c556
MKLAVSLALVATTCAVAMPAAAQFQKPEDAVKYRQSVMTVQNFHLGRLAAIANGRVPFDAKVAQEHAAVLETVTKLAWVGYGPDTEKTKSRSKPEVWMEAAKFKQAQDHMMGEVSKLNVAAKTGNLDQIKASFGNVAGSCKACHDAFRE